MSAEAGVRPARLCCGEQMSCEEQEVASTAQALEQNRGCGGGVPGVSLGPRPPLFILRADPNPPP